MVYKGIRRDDGRVVAVKKVEVSYSLGGLGVFSMEDLRREESGPGGSVPGIVRSFTGAGWALVCRWGQAGLRLRNGRRGPQQAVNMMAARASVPRT